VKLILRVDFAIWRAVTTPRVCDRIFSVSPLIRKAHEVVDGFGLASSQLLPEVPPDEAVSKSIDGSFGRDVLRSVA
jgi:hypothetical protein